MLLVCFGVNAAISTSHVSFPSSVACMVLLFFLLLGSNAVLGEKRTRGIVHMIEVPVRTLGEGLSILLTCAGQLLIEIHQCSIRPGLRTNSTRLAHWRNRSSEAAWPVWYASNEHYTRIWTD